MIQRHPRCWFFIKASGASFYITFYVRFFKKNISHVVFGPNFIVWLSLLLEILSNMCIVVADKTVVQKCTVVESVTPKICKLAMAFLSSHFSTEPKGQDKNANISWTKKSFNMKWKAFSSFLKGFHWSK